MSDPIHGLKFHFSPEYTSSLLALPGWPQAWDPTWKAPSLSPTSSLLSCYHFWPFRGRRFSLTYWGRWSLVLVPSGHGGWDSAKLLLLWHLWGFWRPLWRRLKAHYPTQALAHIYPSVGHTLVLSSYKWMSEGGEKTEKGVAMFPPQTL